VLASVSLRRPFDTPILSKLIGIMAWLMLAFMIVRYGDVVRVGALPLAFAGDVKALSFWIEFGLGALAVILMLPKSNRSSPRLIFLGALAMLLNGALYRLNCYLIGFDPGDGWSYFPSLGEVLVTLGIFALEIMLYLMVVKLLPVLHAVRREARQSAA
jgi:Ni/Fe-hydrogenase subunit HybB-like protein